MLSSLQPYLTPVLGGSYKAVYYIAKGTNKKEQSKYFKDLAEAQTFVDAHIVKDWFAKIENWHCKLMQPCHIKNKRTDAIDSIKKYLAVDKKANLSLVEAAKQISMWYVPLIEIVAHNSTSSDNTSTNMLLSNLNKMLLQKIPLFNKLPTD